MAAPKGRARALSRHGDASTVKVKVDPQRKARFDALLAQMKAARRHETSGFDAYWEAVGEIIASELYVAGGHETADAFFKAVVKEPKRTAMRLIRVARYASPVEEAKYGTAVLDAALAYIEALTGGSIQGRLPVAFDKLRIPVERDGKTSKVPLAEATLREISTATRALVTKSDKPRSRRPPAEARISAAIHKEKSLAGVTVTLSDGKIRFGAMPVSAVALFAKVLASVKLETESEAASESAPKKPEAKPTTKPKAAAKKPKAAAKRKPTTKSVP